MACLYADTFGRNCLKLWWESGKELPCMGFKYSFIEKIKNERAVNKFIDGFIYHLEDFPRDLEKRKSWKEQLHHKIHCFTNESKLLTKSEFDFLFSLGIFEVTRKFVEEARSYDSSISVADIGQAMRNVWIMNIIQVLLGEKVQYTPSIYGYSMLYPYTDNFLDDIGVSAEEKMKINSKFEKRLGGEKIEPANSYEEKLFHMVDKIEGQYERKVYPKVFEALLRIHSGQRNSLFQQKGDLPPYDTDILDISINKGGASVLADAYLVSGDLSEKEAEFFFQYGVLLQLCDDLQDISEDKKIKNMTIFSQLAGRWPLDNITSKLMNFMFQVMEGACFPECKNFGEVKEIIIKNCSLLILFSISRHIELYSRQYSKKVSEYFPFRTRYMRKFYKKLKKKYLSISSVKGGSSVEEILTYAFM